MGSILCALDFNEASGTVLKVAMAMAVRSQAHLTVLFSYRLLPQQKDKKVSELRKQLEEKAKEEFTRLEKKVIGNNRNASYEFRSEIGFLSDRITSFVQASPPQLIVIGQTLIDSMSDQQGIELNQFLALVSTPILIVPQEVSDVDFFLSNAKLQNV